MLINKDKLKQDIEAMEKQLASMKEELNKPDKYKHFPSKGDKYYYYNSIGIVCGSTSADDELRVNVYKTEKEAEKVYNKAVALEKVKRILLELQGDWKPDWNSFSESKYFIIFDNEYGLFSYTDAQILKHAELIPYIKTRDIVHTIINEMDKELRIIFEAA